MDTFTCMKFPTNEVWNTCSRAIQIHGHDVFCILIANVGALCGVGRNYSWRLNVQEYYV